MTTGANESTTINTYELTCNDCTFETTVEGDIFDALDAADTHQEEHGETLTGHFVNFELVDPE